MANIPPPRNANPSNPSNYGQQINMQSQQMSSTQQQFTGHPQYAGSQTNTVYTRQPTQYANPGVPQQQYPQHPSMMPGGYPPNQSPVPSQVNLSKPPLVPYPNQMPIVQHQVQSISSATLSNPGQPPPIQSYPQPRQPQTNYSPMFSNPAAPVQPQFNGQSNAPPQMGSHLRLQGPTQQMHGPPQQFNGPPQQMNGPPQQMNGPPKGPQLPYSSVSNINQSPISRPPINQYTASSSPITSQQMIRPPTSLPPLKEPEKMTFTNGATYPPPTGPSVSRYPQTAQPGMAPPNQQQRFPQSQGYPQNVQQQNGPNALTNQMSQLSVTQQGFNQLWGQQMFDLMTNRHILPEYPEEPPEIRLGQHFTDTNNCSPEIIRCTINKIPDTNNLLQKSRLPLGILIHPFKDLNHLPVIQCSTIVRCRVCRTYINPFVYFVDSKRWKCNLCFRVNDLPEEFMYDPVSKSYGDPTRRPEVKSATIEYIAPGEYMLRPPQPAVYLFLLDISQIARESGYLKIFCETLKENLTQLPGDARTQVGFICYDSSVHFYLMGEDLTRPREMTVMDIEDIFLPSPESLLVNVGDRREMIADLLDALPLKHSGPGLPGSALGAALQAAFKLMAPTGGRISVFQTCLPNVGPGALLPREDPNNRSSAEVSHLNPATDFYKRLALDCSGAQVAVDLFLLNSQYCDLATLSGISKFSGGSVHHIPLFKASRVWQRNQFERMFARYLTRKIGFEAVMRVRCTRGLSIHTFHGNFFVRSTDLLSLPNVSPDSAFGMQLTIEEALTDLQQVCMQAALLYTSSKGERRIRVHTLCLPVAMNLTDVLHAADQQCIIGLLTKMAVDRALSSSLSDAREALSNVSVDLLSAHRLAQNLPAGSGAGLLAPACLRLVPLYLLAVLKHPAFRTGKSTRLDDRIAAMCNMKSLPLYLLIKNIYPDLYPIHNLESYVAHDANAENNEEEEEGLCPDPPVMHLTAERLNSTGAYLLDDGESMIIYIGSSVSPQYLSDTFGVNNYHEIVDEARELPVLSTPGNELLRAFVNRLNDDHPYPSSILVLRDNSPSKTQFTERLIEDRIEQSFSYYEFIQHIKSQMK